MRYARSMAATTSTDRQQPTTASAPQHCAGRVLAVFLCGMFAFLDLYCVQPLLPMLSQVFHATEAQVGITISASTLGVACTAAMLAMFGEQLNRKRAIVVSMVALAVAALLTSTATGLESLAFWRLLQGLVTPGIFIITIAYVTEEWPAMEVPRVMSAYVAGTVFGGFMGRLLGGMVAEFFGWRAVFLVLGAGGLGGALLTARLLPQARAPHVAKPGVSPLAPMLANLRNPRLLATYGIGFCMLFTLVSVFSYITFYLNAAPFHLSTAKISYLFAVYLVGLVFTLAVGRVLARMGLRYGMLLAVGCCLTGLALTLVHVLAVVAVGLAFASSGVFLAQTCANSFLRDAAPAGSRVSAAGLYICAYYIGGTCAGVLPGIVYRRAGWPGCAALTAALLMVAGVTAFFGWRERSSDPIPL